MSDADLRSAIGGSARAMLGLHDQFTNRDVIYALHTQAFTLAAVELLNDDDLAPDDLVDIAHLVEGLDDAARALREVLADQGAV